MGKRVENPRTERLFVLCNPQEQEFFKRCASHAGCNVSELVRHLFTVYGSDHNIPSRTDLPAALTAEQMIAKLGMTNGAQFAQVSADQLADHIDPDKFDDSNTSTMDPLPESFDPSVSR